MTEQTVASLEPRLQKLVESAHTAFDRGDYERTVGLTHEVLTCAPSCFAVRKLHRAAQLKHGASGGLKRLLARASVLPFLVVGNTTLARDPSAALRSAQKILDADPHYATGLRLLGNAATALDWPETAVVAFEALREIAPDDLANLVALGRAHLAAGRAETAVRCAETALAQEAADGDARALLKDASVAQTLKAGRWEEAGDFRAKVKS